MDLPDTCTAFEGHRRIASGPLADVARAAADGGGEVLIFDDASGQVIDIDLRGSPDDVVRRLETPADGLAARRGPGRPKLGVAAREVTLLPRHWDWLSGQPGGASAALRRLVDAARRDGAGPERARLAQEAAYRFATAMAGNAAGYEEAMRALFAKDRAGFEARAAAWPTDIRDHALGLAAPVFEALQG